MYLESTNLEWLCNGINGGWEDSRKNELYTTSLETVD